MQPQQLYLALLRLFFCKRVRSACKTVWLLLRVALAFCQAGAEAAFVCTAAAFFGMRPSEVRTPKMTAGGEKDGASQEGAPGGDEEEAKKSESEPAAGDWRKMQGNKMLRLRLPSPRRDFTSCVSVFLCASRLLCLELSGLKVYLVFLLASSDVWVLCVHLFSSWKSLRCT